MRKIIIINIFIVILLNIFISNSISFKAPEEIPQGKWDYKLLVNGKEAGNAVMTNRKKEGKYFTSSEFNMKIGSVSTISKESITETIDFKPIKLESYNKIISGNNVHETLIKATFKGLNAYIDTNNKINVYKIKKDYILDGNYTISKLIKSSFKIGMEVKANIYHPSIEMEDPIFVKTKVIGIENTKINGKYEKLMHVSQSVESIKSIDLYFGSNGIVKRILIQMLNLKIELIIKK